MVLRSPKGTSGSDDKEFACNAGDLGLITGSGTSPGEGKDYALQYSCLETPWTEERQAIVHGVAESDRTEGLILWLFRGTLLLIAKQPHTHY